MNLVQLQSFLSQDLINRTGELKLLVWSKEERVSEMAEELANRVKSMHKHSETIQQFDQVK